MPKRGLNKRGCLGKVGDPMTIIPEENFRRNSLDFKFFSLQPPLAVSWFSIVLSFCYKFRINDSLKLKFGQSLQCLKIVRNSERKTGYLSKFFCSKRLSFFFYFILLFIRKHPLINNKSPKMFSLFFRVLKTRVPNVSKMVHHKMYHFMRGSAHIFLDQRGRPLTLQAYPLGTFSVFDPQGITMDTTNRIITPRDKI